MLKFLKKTTLLTLALALLCVCPVFAGEETKYGTKTVSVTLTHEKTKTSSLSDFNDLQEGSWYINAIDFVTRYGIMTGYNNGKFGPNDPCTRSQFIQIIYNIQGKPSIQQCRPCPFVDIAADKWYAKAVTWAADKEITHGKSTTIFAPNDNVTRQEMAQFLMNYAKWIGFGSERYGYVDLSKFRDSSRISGWAKEAVSWAYYHKIVAGYDNGNFGAQDICTRAQIAQMIYNYLKEFPDNSYPIKVSGGYSTDMLNAYEDETDVIVNPELAAEYEAFVDSLNNGDNSYINDSADDVTLTMSFDENEFEDMLGAGNNIEITAPEVIKAERVYTNTSYDTYVAVYTVGVKGIPEDKADMYFLRPVKRRFSVTNSTTKKKIDNCDISQAVKYWTAKDNRFIGDPCFSYVTVGDNTKTVETKGSIWIKVPHDKSSSDEYGTYTGSFELEYGIKTDVEPLDFDNYSN